MIEGVELLIDTGADTTLLPSRVLESLRLRPDDSSTCDLIGFDGTPSTAPVAELDMIFLQKIFRGRYVFIDRAHGILGRDVLNSVALLMNGPASEWASVSLK